MIEKGLMDDRFYLIKYGRRWVFDFGLSSTIEIFVSLSLTENLVPENLLHFYGFQLSFLLESFIVPQNKL